MNLHDIKLMLNDAILQNYDFNKNLNYKNNKDIILNFLSKYPYFHRYEILYLLKNKYQLDSLHIFCKVCKKKNNWSKSNGIYHIYCSNKCKSSDPIIKEKISIGNKKVAMHALQKRRKTNKIKYGNENYHNAEKMRYTRLSDIDENGLNSFQRAIKKGHKTNLIKIGVENPFSSDNPEINGKAAIKRKYGYISYTQTDMFKNDMKNRKEEINKHRIETVNKKYGVDYYFQTSEFKTSFKNKMINKFNTTSYQKSQDYKNKKYLIKKKEHDTKKANGLYGKRSKAEIRCFELLKTKFPNIEHSYYDIRYPFNCDIYIPELDLFIECHFSQYHHFKPFNKNCIGDLAELSGLNFESQNIYFNNNHQKYCLEIIKTWTISDPLKLKTFKDNNLNYKIFYTEKEFKDWFEVL